MAERSNSPAEGRDKNLSEQKNEKTVEPELPPASPFSLLSLPGEKQGVFRLAADHRVAVETRQVLALPAVEAERAAAAAAAAKAKLDTGLSDAKMEGVLKAREDTASFKRVLQICQAELAATSPPKTEVIDQTRLPQSCWGLRQVVVPEDVKRPGLLITFSEKDSQAVDEASGVLREATTSALLWSGGFLEVTKTRANSILILKAADVLEREMNRAEASAAAARRMIAVRTLLAAEEKGAGEGGFDKAAESAKADTAERSRGMAKQIAEVAGQTLKQGVCEKAAEMRQQGVEKEWPIHLLGVEVDFENHRPTGIEYYVSTSEGKTYLMSNIQRNFQDQAGSAVPAKAYAEFNVAVLRSYQKNGAISRDTLYSIAMSKGFYPTEDGKIHYLDPGIYKSGLRAIKGRLAAAYAEKKVLSAGDFEAALKE